MISSNIHNQELQIEIGAERFDYTVGSLFKKTVNAQPVEDYDSVIINLEKVEYIDSTAISMLLKFQENQPEDRHPITLRNVRPAIICVIELMRLHRVFAIEPMEEPV